MVVQLWALPQGNNIGALYRTEVLVVQSCLTLCDPLGYSPPGSSVHGILQARDWSRLLFPSPGDFPDPGMEPTSLTSPALGGRVFTTMASWEAQGRGIYLD